MDDSAASLRPLDDASAAIQRLQDYESEADLAAALESVRGAVERTLRLRLRADSSAPERDRITALSARDMPLEEVVKSLRSRDLISLRTAGTIHELQGAVARAREGNARATDADRALEAVSRLREELGAGGTASAGPRPSAPIPPSAAGAAVGVRPKRDAETGNAGLDPGARDSEAAKPPERRGRNMALLGAGLAVLFLVAFGLVLLRGGTGDYEAAVTAFRAGRLDSAAVAFQRVLEDRPEDTSALLYMGRIHRRQGRPGEAAEVLRRAARIDPADGDIRRELGHLFMDLRQPRAAVAQYERALESEPEEARTWAALIMALREAGDPRAERLLSDAPPEVQALLSRGP